MRADHRRPDAAHRRRHSTEPPANTRDRWDAVVDLLLEAAAKHSQREAAARRGSQPTAQEDTR